VLRLDADVQRDVDQSACNRVSRREEASVRGIANLRRAATEQATDRSASDGRAFAQQAVAPMRRTRQFRQMG